jgi:DNA-binding transcriptional regulator YdaS (Cro superfamily)
MQEVMLRKAIYSFGSVKELAKKLGVHREHIYAWIKGISKIPLEHALQIEYLTQGEIHWKDLVPLHVVQRLKHLTLLLPKSDLPPCELVYVSIGRIKCSNGDFLTNPTQSIHSDEGDKLFSLYERRPICLDKENNIIFGEQTVVAYQKRVKKTIPAWRISLLGLANGHYSTELFLKSFTVSERVAIGMALEKFLGNRQGYRSDLARKKKLMKTKKSEKTLNKPLLDGPLNNYAEVILKKLSTRQLVANRLGFGSHFTYQNAKKIKSQGSIELIEQVDRGELSIYKGASFCKLSRTKENNSLLEPQKACHKSSHEKARSSNLDVLTTNSKLSSSNKKDYLLSEVRAC